MTAPKPSASQDPRSPRVFAPGDPALVVPPSAAPDPEAEWDDPEAVDASVPGRPTGADVRRGFRWGGLLIAAMAGLATLAASISFAAFISSALARNDWVGWTATGLLALAAVSGAVIAGRELVGLIRLARLTRLRRDIAEALRTSDVKLERTSVEALKSLYAGRRDLKWGLARLGDHQSDVRDAGDLLRLAERELLAPIDIQARRTILKSAKRVSVVTAMSPMVWVAMLYVMVENLRLLRSLAGLYGGRPGGMGALRLARLVVGHIAATGGLAMTDDLVSQFFGQDLLRRLSRRLGEGVFNGALTARIGTAAVEVTRPLPFLEAKAIRVRDLLPELFRRTQAAVRAR